MGWAEQRRGRAAGRRQLALAAEVPPPFGTRSISLKIAAKNKQRADTSLCRKRGRRTRARTRSLALPLALPSIAFRICMVSPVRRSFTLKPMFLKVRETGSSCSRPSSWLSCLLSIVAARDCGKRWCRKNERKERQPILE